MSDNIANNFPVKEIFNSAVGISCIVIGGMIKAL